MSPEEQRNIKDFMAKRRTKESPNRYPIAFSQFLVIPFLLIVVGLIKLGQFTNLLIIFILKTTLSVIKSLFKVFRLINFTKNILSKFDTNSRKSTLKKEQVQTLVLKKHKKIKPRFLHKLIRDVKVSFNQSIPIRSRWKVLTGLVVILFFIYTFTLIKLAANLPAPDQISNSRNPLTTQIFDRNGKILYQFYEDKNRKLIKLEDLPTDLIHATIAMEDKNFYSHPGIDIGGMIRALKRNISGDTDLQGGSTITQQLIKNTMLTPDKTYTRKIKEIILALWAEKIYSKDEILQSYFNEVPYGGPAWGIEVASEMYFGKKAHDLNLAESSYLAGLTAAPTEYSPYGTHPEKAKERQKEVLRRMVEEKYITPDIASVTYDEKLDIKPPTQNISAAHFVMYVREILAQRYGDAVVSQGGLKVTTTLDIDLQEEAEDIVADNVEKLSGLRVGNGAAMIMDAKNGQILAMVGSKNYFDKNQGNFNVALALRQPGSSIKPITYATAFKQGYTPGSILLDTPTTFKNAWESYSPVNYDGRFHGAVTIRTALGSSYNVPAVKMLSLIGLPAMLQTAKDMGITTLNDTDRYGLSLTLGGGEIKMIDMMTAYNTFATNGIKYNHQSILLVTDSKGNILEDNRNPEGKRVLPEEVAYMITHILSDKNARIPAFGSNSLLEIKDHSFVAVKTGTTDSKRDNWAFGYTPEYVVGAWVGNNDNTPMDPRLTSGITGATPIWHDIMSTLVEERPNLAFNRPKNITETNLNGYKDLTINGLQPKSTVSYSRIKQKDKDSGIEKEVTAYSDPFTNYIPEAQPKATN